MEVNRIYNMDCLEGMKDIPDGAIDMILCDLPYGTTACAWDTIIPFEPLWEQYERIIKDNGAVVLTASQPFTTLLIASNLKLFKYCWVWKKSKGAGFLNAKNAPVKMHEDICVFSKGTTANCSENRMEYNPQGLRKVNRIRQQPRMNDAVGTRPSRTEAYMQEYAGYPCSVIEIPNDGMMLHPTQKPVTLFAYLINTYTNPGELVLDNCIGSGTTAIAAIKTGRNYIGYEIDPEYYSIALNRITTEESQQRLAF